MALIKSLLESIISDNEWEEYVNETDFRDPIQVLKDMLEKYTMDEIIMAIGEDKLQNHLRKNKLKTLKNGWNG